MRAIFVVLLAIAWTMTTTVAQATAAPTTIVNGLLSAQKVLVDTSGARIDAHDGHIYYFAGNYYWYGTAYACGFTLTVPSPYCGVKIYQSVDLVSWKYGGLAFNPAGLQADCDGRAGGCFRPKLAYNGKTARYVMWINESLGAAGSGYLVFTSASPAGPFTLTGHHVMTDNRSPGGFSFGDEDIFVDTDGVAYLAYTTIGAGNSHNIAIEKLDATYSSGTGQYAVHDRGPRLIEAPAMFTRNGVYYLLYGEPACPYCDDSGTSYATAPAPLGPWTFRGGLELSRLGGQVSGVTTIAANGTVQYLFQLDRWHQDAAGNATYNQALGNYYLAPLSFAVGGVISGIPDAASWQTQVQLVSAPTSHPPTQTVSSGYTPLITPIRVLDTRDGVGGPVGPWTDAHGAYRVALPAKYVGTTAIVANVTALGAGPGYLQLWASGAAPASSVVNYSPSRAVAPNLAVIPVAADGSLRVAVRGASAGVLIDIQGFYPATAGFTVSSRRIIDTRNTAAIPAGGTLDVTLPAPAGTPDIAANLTVVASSAGVVQAFRPGQSPGETGAVSFGAGVTANLALLPSGVLRFRNTSAAPVQLIVDQQGYESAASKIVLLVPVRVFRNPASQPCRGFLTYTVPVGAAHVPVDAKAVVAELGSISGVGSITAFADQADRPSVSSLNGTPGVMQSNLAVIPVVGGRFDLYPAGSDAQVSVDVVGYVR